MTDPGSRFEEYLRGLRRLTPVHANRASSLGFPCDRHGWYERREPEHAALPDVGLQGVLEFGVDFEDMLRRRLLAAGYKLRQEQVTRHWREPNITGHPEGWLSWDDGAHWTLFEIKGLHPYYWSRVESWRDFLRMGPIYARYPAQGQIYLLLENQERMLWLLGKKGSYDLKWLWMELDYDLAEGYLRKAERINRAVESGQIPPRTSDRDACEVCPFRLHCLPDQDHGAGAELWQDEELLGNLRRRDELAQAAREYKALDESIKATVRGKPLILVGDYEITGTERIRKGYTVPAGTSWEVRIRRRSEEPSTQSSPL